MRDELEPWLDLASDVLRHLSPQVDWLHVGMLLADHLHAPVAGGFQWTPRAPGVVHAPQEDLTFDLPQIAARAPDAHPLALYYARTRSTQVRAIQQVAPLRTPTGRDYLDELTQAGIEQHLWIPLPRVHGTLQVAGACRAGEPFDDRDIAAARRVQGVLCAVTVHARAIAQWSHRPGVSPESVAAAAHLTPREVVVLDLCSRGLTSQAVAHRLRVSPRTVEKHLENVYTKLGVRDRVSAVLRAQAAGLVSPHVAPVAAR